MERDKYVGRVITVGHTPDIPQADKSYYPTEGGVYQWVDDGDFLHFTVDPNGTNPDMFPKFWNGCRFKYLPAGQGTDPQWVKSGNDRYYAVIYLWDRYFHVWFLERENDEGVIEFECEAESLPNGTFAPKNGGYKNNPN